MGSNPLMDRWEALLKGVKGMSMSEDRRRLGRGPQPRSRRFDGVKYRAKKVEARRLSRNRVKVLCNECHKQRALAGTHGLCENCLRGHEPKRGFPRKKDNDRAERKEANAQARFEAILAAYAGRY